MKLTYYERAMSSNNPSFMQHALMFLIDHNCPEEKVQRLMQRIEYITKEHTPQERFREILSFFS